MPQYQGNYSPYASRGVGAGGLTTGIIGTALGGLALLGEGGGLFGGRGHGYGHHGDAPESKEAAALRQQNAALAAALDAERGDAKLAEKFNHKIEKLEKQICDIRVNDAHTDGRIKSVAKDAEYGDMVNHMKCKTEDERLWCAMPKTERFIPEREIHYPRQPQFMCPCPPPVDPDA